MAARRLAGRLFGVEAAFELCPEAKDQLALEASAKEPPDARSLH